MIDGASTRRFGMAGVVLLAGALFIGCPFGPQSFDPRPNDPELVQGSYRHPAGGKTLTLFGGAGSGAYRSKSDPPFTLWTTSDRGANFPCEDAPLVLGLTALEACPADPAAGVPAGIGRIYPRPGYAPSIYRLEAHLDGSFRVAERIALKTASGVPLTGLLNPQTFATTERPRDGAAKVIAQDASAVDVEGLVRLPQFGGRFFMTDENATGLLEVAHDGRVLKRFVPAGTESDYTHPRAPLAPAGYPIDGALPAILAKRRLNRGIESITLVEGTPFIYFMVQSPLDHPNTSVRDTATIRLFKARIELGKTGSRLHLLGEWVYPLEDAAFFQARGATDAARRRDLRVSEMLHIADQRLLVLERTDQVTGIFEIDLAGATNILNSKWDEPATAPSLEQVVDLAAAGVVLPSKKNRFVASSRPDAEPRLPEKMEGMAFSFDGRLVLLNDDDFGIAGQVIQINLIDEVTRH